MKSAVCLNSKMPFLKPFLICTTDLGVVFLPHLEELQLPPQFLEWEEEAWEEPFHP